MTTQDESRTCPACGTVNPPANSFCGSCGTKLDAQAWQASTTPEERRWATVLFVDISGYTSMSERLDPEDVREAVRDMVGAFSEQIARFGGTVFREMGDEVMGVFGVPLAHEDDPERAVRAAIAIRDSTFTAPDGEPLRIHAGVNTGEIITTVVSLAGRQDYSIHGDTVNTGARLRAAATPGTVLVGEETYRATHRAVRYRALPPIEAKGKEHPVPVWEAMDCSLLPLARETGKGTLIGREAEIGLLTGVWGKVRSEARPHLVTVIGDPGIGKSRLVTEFEHLALSDAVVLHGRCAPYGEALGYWALTMALREAAGIGADDGSAAALAKLDALVAGVMDPNGPGGSRSDIARHLGLLGGLDAGSHEVGRLADQATLYASLRRFLEALARAKPAVLVIDDIHWADDALLNLLEYLAARVRDVPFLIVTLSRPELLERRPAWGRGVRAFTTLSLEPLAEGSSRELIAALAAEHGLTEGIAEGIGRGAGGNPLFAEELVAMLAERGGGSHVPSAIKALISARIDALIPQERIVLQRAAVFGKIFWEGGVRALGVPEPVATYLDELEGKDLLRLQPRSRFSGETEYAFKHDLIQEVASEMVLRADRRALHGRIVDWIEASYRGSSGARGPAGGERADEYLDLLAYHAVEAAQPDRALRYLMQAAERANRAAAHRKEAELLGQALQIAGAQGRQDLETEIHLRRGRAFARVAMWPNARAELETLLEPDAAAGEELRAEVLLDLSTVYTWGAGMANAQHIAEEALEISQRLGRNDLAVGALTYLGLSEAGTGNPVVGLTHFQRARDLARERTVPLRGSSLQGTTMHSIVLYWVGEYDEGIERARETVEGARAQNDTVATMLAMPHLGLALAAKGRYGEAIDAFERARRFGREYEVWGPLARATSMSSGLHLELDDLAGHEALLEEAREMGEQRFPPTLAFTGVDLLMNLARQGEVGRAEALVDTVAQEVQRATAWHKWMSALRLAEAWAEIGLAREDGEDALTWATQAIDLSRRVHRTKYEALGLLARGRALHRLGRTVEALADLRSALELARSTGNLALFLRVAAPLLELDGDAELAAEARGCMGRILANLPEGPLRTAFERSDVAGAVKKLAL